MRNFRAYLKRFSGATVENLNYEKKNDDSQVLRGLDQDSRHTTLHRRFIDVETTLSVYWGELIKGSIYKNEKKKQKNNAIYLLLICV